ncbi:MAG: hypothetical protein ACOWWO_15325 [Peptococcaceae bacterium]
MKKSILAAIFLISLSLFMFEITLTRLFSALMFYHFVFLAVSIAILSLGLGGIWVYKIRTGDKKIYGFKKDNILERSSLLFSLSTFVITLIIYKVPFFPLAFLLYLFLGSLPFMLGGMFLAEAFYQFSPHSLLIYFADLAGSGIGSIIIVKLLDNFSPLTSVLILALLSFTAYLSVTAKEKIFLKTLGIFTFLAVIIISGQRIDHIIADFTAYSGEAKTLSALKNPQSVFTTWNSFARTDVIETEDRKEKLVLVDGSAVSKMLPFNGDTESLNYLEQEIGYLAFAPGNNSNALLIGPGGGMDLLLARYAGITDITAVEINQGTIEAARKYADFNGNIYDLPGTKTRIKDGRSFISTDKGKYNVIYLSMVMTQASETLGYALSENYIYTREAFQEYLRHLKPSGRLALVLHGKNDLQKAVATAISTLEKQGLTRAEAINSIAYLNTNNENSNHHSGIYYPLLLVKNSPFTQEEATELKALTALGGHKVIHLPFIHRDDSLLQEDMSNWIVTDNSPFFYNSAGKKIPGTIWFVLAAILFIGGRALLPYRAVLTAPGNKGYFYYFSLLGLGFMLIEIPVLQKFVLFIGHPTLTFSLIIAVLLTSGGIGSLLASKLKKLSPVIPAGFVAAYTIFISSFLPKIFTSWQGASLEVKMLVTIITLAPLGLALGIPFPSGLSQLESTKELIPLMWGINGWASVLGSILALMIAMILGYSWALLLGSLIYSLFIVNYMIFTKNASFTKT